MQRMLLVGALAVAVGVGCGGACSGDSSRGPETAPSPSPVTEARPGEPAITTERLTPQTFRLTEEDLPAPFATESAERSPNVVDPPDDATLAAPPGFEVQLFATEVPHARWLAVHPDGRLLVAQSRENRITWLADDDGDGRADRRGTFADESNGLDIPFGMAFSEDRFFLGNQSEVRTFAIGDAGEALRGEGERLVPLPGGGYRQHWTRNVLLSPDAKTLFVSIGSRTNVDPEELPRASIQAVDLDSGRMRTFASGLRNPVGLAIHPETGALYATVNERDELGDDLVPDFFTRVEEGAFYGWPYAYLTPRHLDPRRMSGGRSEEPALAARTRTPDVLFQAHSAALGVAFPVGDAFPDRYRRGAYVAFRGSWNRAAGTGYKIVFVPFDGDTPEGSYEDFVTGFLIDPSGPTTWGRPVGVLGHPDGSLYFTEEANGRVYRVWYVGDEAGG